VRWRGADDDLSVGAAVRLIVDGHEIVSATDQDQDLDQRRMPHCGELATGGTPRQRAPALHCAQLHDRRRSELGMSNVTRP
jgi:hypothetical protein